MRVLIKPHQNSIQTAVRGTWWLRHVRAVELVSAAGNLMKQRMYPLNLTKNGIITSSNKNACFN